MIDARTPGFLVLFAAVALAACGDGKPAGIPAATVHPLLGDRPQATADDGPEFAGKITAIAGLPAPERTLTVDYPLDESVFPPEFVPPTFLWHDDAPGADTWLVTVTTSKSTLHLLVPGAPPPEPVFDMEAFSETNEPFYGTEYQRSARTWTPAVETWEKMKTLAAAEVATVTFTGFASSGPAKVVSHGSTRIRTAKDPVGAPLFYRDVPLMPSKGEKGKIQPLGRGAMPLIAWRLRDVSMPESRVVLKSMPSCGNCHSFSQDGKTLGMDIDGPDGDKGMYAVKDLEPETVIGKDDVITWNSFPDRPADHRTIGFLSRISPDGQFVVSTVNEALYVANYVDYKFLQVFYPTRGILAYWSRADGAMRALPGADDPAYVHCAPSWTPDGKNLVFCRATACDPEPVNGMMPAYPNDPNELPMKYGLYRIPFDGGKGGTPVPVEGASNNGMSNSFPKISPDGKWIVFVKCKNGQLLRPDGRLWIVPFEGGEARQMRCNMETMNSWHSFSPNGRWMVFASKQNRPYTQAFLTHIDENGNDSPAILVPNCTAGNRAVNLPEFMNAPADSLQSISVPAVNHHVHVHAAEKLMVEGKAKEAIELLEKAFETDASFFRAHSDMGVCLNALRRNREALDHFVRAHETDPSDILARYNIGVSSLNLGRSKDAVDAFRDVKRRAPGYPEIDLRIREAEDQMKGLAAATERCRQEVVKKPDDASLKGTLAGLLEAAGRDREAVEQLERALALSPKDIDLLRRLSWRLATTFDADVRSGEKAVVVAERAMRAEKPRTWVTLDVLAVALACAGRFEEAVRVAEEARDLGRKVSAGRAALITGRLELYREGKAWLPPSFRP